MLSVRTCALEQFVSVGKYLCYVDRTKGDRPSEEVEEKKNSVKISSRLIDPQYEWDKNAV